MAFNMKALQKMQEKMLKMQEDLANSTFEGTAGGGGVTVTMTGRFELTGVKLSPEVVDPEDVEILEDLIVAAAQDAFNKVVAKQQELIASATGGLQLPF